MIMDGALEYRVIVLTHRLKVPGVLETMADQAPELRNAMSKAVSELTPAISRLGGNGWTVNSHSITVHNELLIASFLVCRPAVTSGADAQLPAAHPGGGAPPATTKR
jgi:hypothetical protein